MAFEPVPALADKLAASVPDVVRKAASDTIGTVNFTVTGELSGSSSMAVDDLGQIITVETTTIDLEASLRGITHIDLLKIDVEGFDLSVLKGALGLLRDGRIAVAQFEYNWRWRFNRAFLADVFDLIADLPYVLGKLVQGGVEIYEVWHPELDQFVEANFVLIRSDRMPLVKPHLGRFDRSNTYA